MHRFGYAFSVTVTEDSVTPPGLSGCAIRYDETEGQFSPDGRWLAYVSNESGRAEVFVQAFPGGQPRTQVSTAGGTQVRWSADGGEIFYSAPDGMMMAAAVALSDASPDVKLPVPLFRHTSQPGRTF